MTERGLVVSEFIRRFREEKPTLDSNRRVKRSDFWWLKEDDEPTASSFQKVIEMAPLLETDAADQRESLLSLHLSSIGSFTPTAHSSLPPESTQSVESIGAALLTEDACEEAYSRCHEILKQIRLPAPSTALGGSDSPLDTSWFSAGPISLGGSHKQMDDYSCEDEDHDDRSAASASCNEDRVLQASYSMDIGSTAWEILLHDESCGAHHASAAVPLGPLPPTAASADSAPEGAARGDGEDVESSVLFISPASSLQSYDFLVLARGAAAEADHPAASASPSAADDADLPPSPPHGDEKVSPPSNDAAKRTRTCESERAGAVSVFAVPAACVDEALVLPFLRDEALLELWGRLREVRAKAVTLRAVLAAAP